VWVMYSLVSASYLARDYSDCPEAANDGCTRQSLLCVCIWRSMEVYRAQGHAMSAGGCGQHFCLNMYSSLFRCRVKIVPLSQLDGSPVRRLQKSRFFDML